MNNSSQDTIILIAIQEPLNASDEQRLIDILKTVPGRQKFVIENHRVLKIWGEDPINPEQILNTLASQGLTLQAKIDSIKTPVHPQASEKILQIAVQGMTCHSCELLIERAWNGIEGVQKVTVNAKNGIASVVTDGRTVPLSAFQRSLNNPKYQVSFQNSAPRVTHEPNVTKKTNWLHIVLLFFISLIVVRIFNTFGLLQNNFTINTGVGIGTAFIIGLIASVSSCLAINAGLLISAAAQYGERNPSATKLEKMFPSFMFVGGRIASYGILGAGLGYLGKALVPSPLITSALVLMAAAYMIIMGLNMLHIAPHWLVRLLPSSPKLLSQNILSLESKKHYLTPLMLGAGTFFLPCGFTQALQLYALTTGSPWQSGLILLFFALGTAPALLALGYAGSSRQGMFGKAFHQFAGALIIVMGLTNIQNGLTIAGYPLSLPQFTPQIAKSPSELSQSLTPAEINEEGVQVVRMKVSGGYTPEKFLVKAGIPVRWEVDGTDALGCDAFLMSRQLGIEKLLDVGINTFTFTPEKPGTIQFSCSMGMYRGSFTVIN